MANRLDIKTKTLHLSNGDAVVLDEDSHAALSNVSWYKHSQGYAVRSEGSVRKGTFKQYLMHREIVGAKPGEYVDHINGDKLDNRRCNLRICSNKNNVVNSKPHKDSSSKYKGVSWYSPTKNWTAKVSSDGIHYYLGRFDSQEEAAVAYDKKAVELFGEYAYLNFPKKGVSDV